MTTIQSFSADQKVLSEALSKVSQVITKSSPDFYRRIHATSSDSWLVLTGANSVTMTKAGIAIEKFLGDPGDFVFPKEVAAAMASFPAGDVYVKETEVNIIFTSEHGPRFQFNKHIPADYPKITFPTEHAADLSAAQLTKILRSLEAVPTAENILIATNDGYLRIVATDSYRLVIADLLDVPFTTRAVVPVEFFSLIKATVGTDNDTTLAINPTRVSIRTKTEALAVQQNKEPYPNYTTIPDTFKRFGEPHRFSTQKKDLLAAAKRMTVLTGESGFIPMRFAFSEEKGGADTHIIKIDTGKAEESLGGHWVGPSMSIGFNIRFLRDALSALSGDSVVISLMKPSQPTLLQTPSDALVRVYVMPVVF